MKEATNVLKKSQQIDRIILLNRSYILFSLLLWNNTSLVELERAHREIRFNITPKQTIATVNCMCWTARTVAISIGNRNDVQK